MCVGGYLVTNLTSPKLFSNQCVAGLVLCNCFSSLARAFECFYVHNYCENIVPHRHYLKEGGGENAEIIGITLIPGYKNKMESCYVSESYIKILIR